MSLPLTKGPSILVWRIHEFTSDEVSMYLSLFLSICE